MNDKAVLTKLNWQYIIVDEGHRMKNTNSKFAMILGQNYQSAHRLLLTGTPLQNDLSELWALLNFLLPKIFQSCEEFKKWFDKPIAKMQSTNGKQIKDEEKKAFQLTEEEQLVIINRLHQVLRPFLLRRVKSEVLKELPTKVERLIKVDMSAWQQILYENITKKMFVSMDPSGKFPKSLQNTMMQQRKVANHPYLFYDFLEARFLGDNLFRAAGKLELLDRMLPKIIRAGHKTLVFCQMTQVLDILQQYFEAK